MKTNKDMVNNWNAAHDKGGIRGTYCPVVDIGVGC